MSKKKQVFFVSLNIFYQRNKEESRGHTLQGLHSEVLFNIPLTKYIAFTLHRDGTILRKPTIVSEIGPIENEI